MNNILGIDVGGSGIKGALVNLKKGDFASERYRIETPPNAKPEEIGKIIKEIAKHFDYQGIIGIGFPSVIKNGKILTAANISKKNIGVNAQKLFSKLCNTKVFIINDADAAAIAEMEFGYGKDKKGKILFLTLGTGIGSALFLDGNLIPNTEFGHIYLQNGKIAEKYAASSIRKIENLDWAEWGKRLNTYLLTVDKILTPDLIILGGGVSKKFEKFSDQIELKNKVVAATLLNKAGIIGAALWAKKQK